MKRGWMYALIMPLMVLLPTAQAKTVGRQPNSQSAFDAPPCAVDAVQPVKREPANTMLEPPVADMYGTSEVEPEGAVSANGVKMSWAVHPRLAYGNTPPPSWTSMVPWGQVFISKEGSQASNTRVEVRNLRLFIRPKFTARWCLAQAISAPKGGLFRTDFDNDRHDSGNPRVEPDGGRSFAIQVGRFVHVFPNVRVPIPAGGVSGVYTDFEVRKIKAEPSGPDDRDMVSLVASAGADYWASADAPSGHVGVLNADAGIGRFRRVGNAWQVYSMNTAAPGAHRKWATPPPAGN